jgi:hypothetical protein
MHLRYTSYFGGPTEHPQALMRALGIKYEIAVPQSVADQWWFFNCTSVPDPLPPYLTELQITPCQAVGLGLTQEMAEQLERRASPSTGGSTSN